MHDELPFIVGEHINQDDDDIDFVYLWGKDGQGHGRVAMVYGELGYNARDMATFLAERANYPNLTIGVTQYLIVCYKKFPDGTYYFRELFFCSADNVGHALEQAKDAYRECTHFRPFLSAGQLQESVFMQVD